MLEAPRGESGLLARMLPHLSTDDRIEVGPGDDAAVVRLPSTRMVVTTDTLVEGFDFLLPIYFLGLVMDFRKRPLWLPVVAISAAVSIAAFYLVGSPWHVSIGAAAGIALAAALTPAKRGAGR